MHFLNRLLNIFLFSLYNYDKNNNNNYYYLCYYTKNIYLLLIHVCIL